MCSNNIYQIRVYSFVGGVVGGASGGGIGAVVGKQYLIR